jgi:hypothetical protein
MPGAHGYDPLEAGATGSGNFTFEAVVSRDGEDLCSPITTHLWWHDERAVD